MKEGTKKLTAVVVGGLSAGIPIIWGGGLKAYEALQQNAPAAYDYLSSVAPDLSNLTTPDGIARGGAAVLAVGLTYIASKVALPVVKGIGHLIGANLEEKTVYRI